MYLCFRGSGALGAALVFCARPPGSDRVNQTHMVSKRFGPRLLWANRRGGLGGGRTEGRGQQGGPWSQHLPPVSSFSPQLWTDHLHGSGSHDADGRSHRCVNFSFISTEGRAGISRACVLPLSKQTFSPRGRRIVGAIGLFCSRSSAEGWGGDRSTPNPAPRRRTRGTRREHPASSGSSEAQRAPTKSHFKGRGFYLLLV